MVFLYTNAQAFNTAQNNPAESIGGYVSSSIIPNNLFGNLFDDVSFNSIVQKRVDTRGVILKNTTGVSVTNILFGFKYPLNPSFKLEVAFVTLDSLNQRIEKLPNGNASPYSASWQEPFVDLSGAPDNSVNIGGLNNNAMLGVWLKRTMNGSVAVPTFATLQEEIDYYKSITDPAYDFSQKIQLIIKYTTP